MACNINRLRRGQAWRRDSRRYVSDAARPIAATACLRIEEGKVTLMFGGQVLEGCCSLSSEVVVD